MSGTKPVLGRSARIAAALALAGVLIATACSRPGTSTDAPDGGRPIAVAIDFLKNSGDAGIYIADDAGYYRAEGLSVQIMEGGPNSPAPETALASGDAKIAEESNPIRLLDAISKGQDLVVVGAIYQTTPFGLLSLSKRPVRDTADLNGARILAAERNRPSIAGLMKRNNVTDYQFLTAGVGVDGLLAGQGDALLAARFSQPVVLTQKFQLTEGKDFYFATMDSLGMPTYQKFVVVTRAYLQENRADVVGYLRATIKGWQDNIADPQRGTDLAVNKYGAHLGLDAASEALSNKAQLPFLESDQTRQRGLFVIDPAQVAGPMYDGMRASGLTNLPDPATFIDPTVQADAVRGTTPS